MTYGWAILIIAVVLVILFSLGITNPLFFAPKAIAGSCQVVRTTVGQSLEGICNNEIPQFSGVFYGSTATVSNIPSSSFPSGNEPFTVTLWINTHNNNNEEYLFNYGTCPNDINIEYDSGRIKLKQCPSDISQFSTEPLTPLITDNQWHFIAVTYNYSNNPNVVFYFDGAQVTPPYFRSQSYPYPLDTELGSSTAYMGIGSDPQWVGEISNVQFYNTTLSPADIKALYQEGIGGDPIALSKLVGWWPLNGNANDYSGNNNNGDANGIRWNGNWWQDYSSS